MAVLAAVASTVVWTPTAAATACAGTGGVTVVVDFAATGGGVRVGCAGGDPGSGFQALRAAGFTVTPVNNQPGMVCKIDSRPGDGSCLRPPETDAYWSYWHAPRGGGWTYSTIGAGFRDPKPGTVEGWAFGAGSPPGVAPPAPPAAPKPPPPRPPDPTETARPTQPAPPANPSQPERTTTARPGAPTSTTTTPATSTGDPAATTTSTRTRAASDSGQAGSPVSADVEPRAGEPADDGGGLTSFLLGGAAILLIGGLAFGAARRRAKADP